MTESASVHRDASRGRRRRVRLYLEMIRFSHTIFALPFAVLAAVWCVALAVRTDTGEAAVSPRRWTALVICMVAARSFAMTINRLADRRIDAANPRTANRHLPAGLITPGAAAAFAGMSALLFIAGCGLFLPNRWPVYLCVPVLLFLAGYSYAKRVTSAVHFYLGASLMLAPVCVWIALRGEVLERELSDVLPAVLLGAAVWLWVSGFDLIYACQDADYDRSAGLRSIPAAIGVAGALRLAAVLHAAMLLPAVAVWYFCPQLDLGALYLLGLAAIAAVLFYEHRLVKHDDLRRVNEAFFNANAVVGVIFLAAGGLDAWW